MLESGHDQWSNFARGPPKDRLYSNLISFHLVILLKKNVKYFQFSTIHKSRWPS